MEIFHLKVIFINDESFVFIEDIILFNKIALINKIVCCKVYLPKW